jgi:DNA-binding NarL/FixJ family response regulator
MARAVELGAAGVLHKSVRAGEVIDAVRRAAQGEHLFTQQEIEELLRLAAQRREEDRAADFALRQLTAREMEVLQSLSEGLSDKLIAQRLHVSTETVRSHMVRILSKLDVNSRLQALVFAVRHGVIEIK